MIDDVIIGEIVPRYNWLRNQHNDWLIIAERPTGSISYIQDENTSSTTHANRTEMGGSDRSTWSKHFDCLWESMGSWAGTNNLVFCSGYDAPTLFPNLQYRSLACWERNTLYTRYPLWSMVRLAPICHRGTHWIALWIWAIGSFTSTRIFKK